MIAIYEKLTCLKPQTPVVHGTPCLIVNCETSKEVEHKKTEIL